MSQKANSRDLPLSNEQVGRKESLLDVYTKHGAMQHYLGVTTQQVFTKPLGELDFLGTVSRLVKEGRKIKKGDLNYADKVLLVQAQTLDTMFNYLACNASLSDSIEHFDSTMRLALKAQSQCRATLETLAMIKNPPQLAMVKQANIGFNQQINNGLRSEAAIKTRCGKKTKNQQNQLLEANHGERLDVRAQSKSSNSNKDMEAMEKLDRTQKRRG